LDNTFALKHAPDFVNLRTDIVSSEPDLAEAFNV